MANVCFFSVAQYGHTYGALALIRELVAQGDRVTWYSEERFRAPIEATGASYRRYPHDAQVEKALEVGITFCQLVSTQQVLASELAMLRDDPPDYILYDYMAIPGLYAARLLNLPSVCLYTSLAFNARVWSLLRRQDQPPGMKSGDRQRQLVGRAWQALGNRHGVFPDLGNRAGPAERVLVCTSRSFQPYAETFDARHEFIGPLSVFRDETPADAITEPGDKPLVYISLGTIRNDDRALFMTCCEALAAVDADVVVSTGGGLPADTFEAIPANTRIVEFVPQLAMLQNADAFITHGGLNSVSESLYHDVPVVVLPQHGDQFVVARRLTELGAGLHLESWNISPAVLCEAVERVLGDDAIRGAAQQVGASLRQAADATRAARYLRTFAARLGID